MKDFYRSCHSLVLCALLAVMCVFTATHTMAAPITWTGKASMPTPRSRAASGLVNGKIFVLGGDTAGSTAVEMYDPAKDTWQSWPPLVQPIFAPCQVTLGDTIYMVGMNSSQVVAYRTFIHAGSPNPLPVPSPNGYSEVVGNLNTTRSNRAQAALVNKKMYIVGTGPNMDQIEEFDLTTFTSVTKNTTLPAGRDLPMVTALDGRIYIMGGINGGVTTTTIWQYDPVSDSIFETGSLPSPMAGNMVATWGGKIYIAGANTNGAAPPAWDGTLWEYDVRGSFWNSYDAVPTSRYAAAVQVWNGSLYVIGGDSGGDTPTSLATNEAARLPSGSPRWSTRDINSPQVVHPSIATVDGKIFVLGGRTSINFSGQRDVYIFDPVAPASSWQRMPDLVSPILAAPAAVHGQKIYLAGGESPTGTSADIQYYDTATVPYTSGIAASLRYPRAKAGAAILNNRLYVIGGGTAAIEEFDLTTTPITRTERVDYLPEALMQPTVVAANGRIYIMGGTVATGPAANTVSDVCLSYDPMGYSGPFTPCAPMPVALDENEGAALIDGKIYLVGGGTNGLYSPDTTSAVQKYDPLSDAWEVSDTMTTSRRDHGIAYTNGHIYVMGGWLNGGGYWANTTEEYTVPFIWRVNSYNGDAVDWPGSLHGTVPTGSYLLIGGKYHYVRASYPGSWSGQGFNMAVLQQCDQYSGEPLFDPAIPGIPLAPDLSGAVFQSITLLNTWAPRTKPTWTVSSIDPGSISGIDWPAATHGPVTPGTYLQVGPTIYYVMASGTGSWRGSDYVYAYLYNCDQTTGQVIDYGANMTGSVGATIANYLFPPQISVSPQSFDFGTTTFPFISSAQMFSIGNFGGAPLVVSSMGIAGVDAGHFSISSYDTCGSAPTLAPGSSCSIFIVYAPQDTGTRNAMLQVVSNDPTTPTATMPLSGNSALVPLTLSFAGTGSGTVAFSNGDSCTGSCSRSFTATTTLTLTANAVPGAQFTGWAGCGSVTGNQCTVSMMSAQNVTATFDLIPPPAEVWSTKAPMPTGLSRAFSAVVNGSIFVLGGSPTTANVQRYNPQSDTWAQQSPLPTPLFGGAAAVQGQIIYLAGGFNSAMDFQNGILAYDTVTGSTQQVGTLVTARARVNGTILNNRLYVVGGSNALSSIEEFDLGTGNSSIIATLPEPTELAAVIGNLDNLYLFGGGTDNTKSWRFDTVSRTFYPLAPSPVSIGARSVTFDNGRALLVDTWGFNNVNNVLEYSFQLDSWKIVTTVPTLRNVPIVEAVNGVIHVIGGDTPAGTLNEAWRFGSAPPVLSHTVTPVAGPNGSITPTTPQSVADGGTLSFSVQPYPGYHISSVSGCSGTLSGTTFTTGPITADCTVNALFAADSSGDICTKVDMVWYSGGSEIRRDYNCASAQASPSGYCYSFQTDACSGYRCVTGNEITPACYSEAQCAAACGGQCVQIQTQKTSCASLPASYPVLVTISGGGTVHSSVTPDINCSSGTCSQSYPSGTSIQLTASPAAGADFVSWVGCDSVAGTVCTIGNLGAARRLTATFVAAGTPAFTPGASMTVAREFHTATLLPNGKVLVAGGWPGLATAELYDPATDSWTPAANLTVGRHSHTATLLSSGKVLVAGGYPNKTSAELYDPATNSWSPAGNLATGRSAHTATRLADGKVLVAAGYDPTANVPIASAEVYDPASGTWSPAGTLVSGRQWHTATRLASGKVLVVGGSTTHSASNALATGELYDPASNSWTAAGNLANSRQQHTATILGNGKVLIAGGWGSGGMQATVEVYDPATGTWSSTGSLAKARFFHTATMLATGKVLVAGGHIATYEENGPLASAEIFDPDTGTWSSAGNLAYAREYHSETLLADGRILIVGGSNSQGTLASAELFGTLATSHQLTVTLTGSGQGTVHSTPAPDIACLSGVCSQSYAPDTGVTLTATPASGFTFVGWGDDCSGTGTCQVTMNAGKTVKATFAAKGDNVPPEITSFAMPASASTLTVPVTTFIASDNVAVTGYLIGESAVPPAAGAAGWTSTPPTSFTFLAPGNCYAYAWVKDGAGNVSAASIAMVDITIANPVDTVVPVITTFSLGAPNAQSVSVTLAVTDNVGVSGYLLSEDPSMPLSNDSRWRSTPPSSFTFASYGNKTLYAWAKDASDNISAGVMATTLLMDPEAALNTVITGWPANPMPYSPSVFTFIASRASAGFECSLDNQGYSPCTSPISFGSLANGSHTFSVRAKDGSVTDDTPATFTWTVQLPLVQVLLNTYPSVLDAYLATSDGASLKIKGIEFRETLVFDRPVAITLQGGYDAAYLNTDGTSVIHGSIAIGQGTVTIDNITIM